MTDSPGLSRKARELVLSPNNAVWISVASVWEIAIKYALGRGNMPVSGGEALQYFQDSGYRLLAVKAEHAVAIESLPLHHLDPFDRMLIAQAMVEPMRLLTHDVLVARYSDFILMV